MPLYEYECEACGNRFERIQKFSDPLADTCPACGGHVHKLLSSPAIQFKGSGWYVTDYARKAQSAGKKEAETGTGGNDAAPAPNGAKEARVKPGDAAKAATAVATPDSASTKKGS
jgi:putative FmdB family regulatory protein